MDVALSAVPTRPRLAVDGLLALSAAPTSALAHSSRGHLLCAATLPAKQILVSPDVCVAGVATPWLRTHTSATMISRLAVAALLALSSAPMSVLADAGSAPAPTGNGADKAMPPSGTGVKPPADDMAPMEAPDDSMDAEGPAQAPVGADATVTTKKDPSNPV
jgi:hypothetical protein